MQYYCLELALCRACIVMLHGSPHLNFLSYRWSLDIWYVLEICSFLFILEASLFLSILFWISHNFLITILLILLPLGNSSIVVCYIQLTLHDLGVQIGELYLLMHFSHRTCHNSTVSMISFLVFLFKFVVPHHIQVCRHELYNSCCFKKGDLSKRTPGKLMKENDCILILHSEVTCKVCSYLFVSCLLYIIEKCFW